MEGRFYIQNIFSYFYQQTPHYLDMIVVLINQVVYVGIAKY